MDWRITSSALVGLIAIFTIIWSKFQTNWMDEYRSLYLSVAFDTPLINNIWNVYLDEDTDSLIYVKKECSIEDVLPRFFLHLVPVDPNDLSDRQPSTFDNQDFWANELGQRLEHNICVIKAELPYDISSISTGQFIEEDGQFTSLWNEEAAIDPDRAG